MKAFPFQTYVDWSLPFKVAFVFTAERNARPGWSSGLTSVGAFVNWITVLWQNVLKISGNVPHTFFGWEIKCIQRNSIIFLHLWVLPVPGEKKSNSVSTIVCVHYIPLSSFWLVGSGGELAEFLRPQMETYRVICISQEQEGQYQKKKTPPLFIWTRAMIFFEGIRLPHCLLFLWMLIAAESRLKRHR